MASSTVASTLFQPKRLPIEDVSLLLRTPSSQASTDHLPEDLLSCIIRFGAWKADYTFPNLSFVSKTWLRAMNFVRLDIAWPPPVITLPQQPQILVHEQNEKSIWHRVHWTVSAKKVCSSERFAVSPPIKFSLGTQCPELTFKLMIRPVGQGSFKNSNGHGVIRLKCEDDRGISFAGVSFCIGLGWGPNCQKLRGPVHHNFAQSSVASLAHSEDVWDFREVVDDNSSIFAVTLEVTSLMDMGV